MSKRVHNFCAGPCTLPLPALDGGRLVFLFYELIARRPPNKVLEERVHMIGMVALLGLIAWATVNDVKGDKAPVWRTYAAQFNNEVAKLEAEGAESSEDAEPGECGCREADPHSPRR